MKFLFLQKHTCHKINRKTVYGETLIKYQSYNVLLTGWIDNKAKPTEEHLNFYLFPPVVGQPPKIEGNGMNSAYNCSFQHIIGLLSVDHGHHGK